MSDHDDVVAKISEAYEKRGFQVQNRIPLERYETVICATSAS